MRSKDRTGQSVVGMPCIKARTARSSALPCGLFIATSSNIIHLKYTRVVRDVEACYTGVRHLVSIGCRVGSVINQFAYSQSQDLVENASASAAQITGGVIDGIGVMARWRDMASMMLL